MEGLGELHARGLGHGDVQEDDVRLLLRALLAADESLHGLTSVAGLLDGGDATRLLEQVPELRARGCLVIDNECVQHVHHPTFSALGRSKT